MNHSHAEFTEKCSRIRTWMKDRSVSSLLLTEAHHFSWLTGGGENFVFLAKSGGAGPLLITPDRVCLVSDNIEAARLFPEELVGLPIEDKCYEWFLSPAQASEHLSRVAEGPIIRDTEVESELHSLHTPLLDSELDRYRYLGKKAEEAIRDTCHSIEPGMTEYQIAGVLANQAYQREIWPVLTLVAADERLEQYRHPLPTSKPIEQTVMVVLCARRYGLIANVTRIVSFGAPSEMLQRKHKAVCEIDAEMIMASRPGVRYGEIVRQAIEGYTAAGFGEEWTLHHQGGPTGYLGRYIKATADTDALVKNRQAIAWNPSIAGTKSEDTILVQDDGVEVLTLAKDWPMVDVETPGGKIQRCNILVR